MPKLWIPKRALFTPAALAEPYAEQIYERVQALGVPITELKSNRITGLRGKDERETYRNGKNTLAVVTAPPGQFKLQPIPPSADFQYHLAQGCPAHCQYCYLAGSLSGVPVTKVYANLPAILDNLCNYITPGRLTTFEASCYTDPLGIEHLTGSLAESIRWFGRNEGVRLRWVSKYDHTEPLLDLPHTGNTRCRVSINADPVSGRMEGGTAKVPARLAAFSRLAYEGGYKVGIVLAPIIALENWEAHYTQLLKEIADHFDQPCDLTFELITHRFTPKSRDVLTGWYPNTQLDMSAENRSIKRNKFGGQKYVYERDVMKRLKTWFYREVGELFPFAEILYWT